MERHQGLILALTLALQSAACQDNPPPSFDFYDRPLRVVAVSPAPDDGPIARDQTFTLTLNAWPDPAPLTWYNTASLASGGARASVQTSLLMVPRQIHVSLRAPLEPDLYYTLDLNPETLRSITGQPLEPPTNLTFLVGDYRMADLQPPPADPTPTRWRDVAPLLAPCDRCHDDPAWRLPAISPRALIGQPSTQQPDLLLVHPFDPERSYLMHKLLWDYPLREGTAQPPPWDGGQPLPEQDLRLIERWIRGGALR